MKNRLVLLLAVAALAFWLPLALMGQTPTGSTAPPVVVLVPAPPIPAETALSWLIPRINATMAVDSATKSDFRILTVSGTFTIGAQLQDKGGISVVPPDGTVWRVLIDDAPAAPPVAWGGIVSMDSDRWEDGTHAVAIDIVDGGPGAENVSPRVIPFVVRNGAGPAATDPQRIPIAGLVYHQLTFSQRVAWANYPGRLPFGHEIPLAIPAGIPAQVDALALRGAAYWTAEAIGRPPSGLYRPQARFYTAGNGAVITAPHYARGDSSSEGQRAQNDRMDWWPGTRGDFSPYSTLVADPSGSGWIGVDISGTVLSVSRVGKTVVRFGPTNPRTWERSCVACHENTATGAPQRAPAMPPHWWHDATATAAQFAADKEFVGTYDVRPSVTNDIAVDPSDRDILYVADTGNNRIARLDLHNSHEAFGPKGHNVPRLTTWAGGAAGYVDGPRGSARFDRPTSIAIDRGVMWVADRDNCALRRIDMATGMVETVAGGHMATSPKPTEALTRPNVYAAQQPPEGVDAWIRYPQCVRVDSRGVPIVAENLTKAIKAVDPATGIVTFISTSPADGVSGNNPWTWIEVDRLGLIGPVDDILEPWISGRSNSYIGRHARDGSWHGTFLAGKGDRYGGAADKVEPDYGRHYSWMAAIALDGSVLTTGMGSSGPALLRRRVPGDAVPEDSAAWKRGQEIHRLGTSFAAMNVRPSFAALHGTFGYSSLGGQSFDEAATWWASVSASHGADAAFAVGADELRRGWGDGVARPEMTGIDAWSYAYFVLRASAVRGWTMPPKPVATGPAPAISGVVVSRVNTTAFVTWQTNTPTIGLVRYGRGAAPIGRSWDAEDAFGVDHAATLEDVPPDAVAWWVTVRDSFGRVATAMVVQ